jgi:hypothetical protein
VALEQQDVERIVRGALKELGVTAGTVHVVQDGQSGNWTIDCGGPKTLKLRCSSGTTPQWVREQIFDQYLSR